MSDGPEPNRIELSDNSDQVKPDTMSEGQGTTESATQDTKGGAGAEGQTEEKGNFFCYFMPSHTD